MKLYQDAEPAEAVAQMDTTDCFSNAAIPAGSRVVWLSGVGITAMPPADWPEELLRQAGISDERLEELTKYLGASV